MKTRFLSHLLCPKVDSYHLKVGVDTHNITTRVSFSILIHILHQKLPLHPILTLVLWLTSKFYLHIDYHFLYFIICDSK